MLVDDVTRACIGRPWLPLVLDVHTRVVLGFYLSLDAPSATSAAPAVAHAIRPKADWLRDRGIELPWPAHGLPEIIHVDNGKEFHSRAFQRGCQQHGIRIEYRPPATPRFGGHIERLMGTLMGRVHALPGSTSSNVASRGVYEAEGHAVLSFREFERILALEVLGPYHDGVCGGAGTGTRWYWDGVAGELSLKALVDVIPKLVTVLLWVRSERWEQPARAALEATGLMHRWARAGLVHNPLAFQCHSARGY